MKIAFIGIGIMGSRMAPHLLADHELTVWNRTKEKTDDLISKGASRADTPADAAENKDIVITMLADPTAIEEVVFGENGVMKTLPENALWIDSSTVNPMFVKKLAARCKDRGVRFLEAPVSGSRPHAIKGELTFLIGGDTSDLETARPVLEKMGQKIVHLGKYGQAMSMKLIINQYFGAMLVGFCEAISTGTKLGIDKDQIIDVIMGSPLAAPYLVWKSEGIRNDEYEADFPLRLFHKDMQMMVETAYTVNAKMPVCSTVRETFLAAVNDGLGDLDMTAILKYVEK